MFYYIVRQYQQKKQIMPLIIIIYLKFIDLNIKDNRLLTLKDRSHEC
jgi:hypothetical protein